MSEKWDGIDLNFDAVLGEVIDEGKWMGVEPSANETLTGDIGFDMWSQFGGASSGDEFSVVGEVKESRSGVSWGASGETDVTSVRSGDLERRNYVVGRGMVMDSTGFGDGGSSAYGLNVFGGAEGFGSGVYEGVNRGNEMKNGDLEGQNGGVRGGINIGFVKWASSVDGFRGITELKDSADGVSGGISTAGEMKVCDLEGQIGAVRSEIEINNDEVVTGAEVGRREYNADGVNMRGERESEFTRMAETCLLDDLPVSLTSGMEESEWELVNDETNVVGLIKGIGNTVKVDIPMGLNARHEANKEHLSGNGISNGKPGVVEVSYESNLALFDGVNNATSFCKEVNPRENQDAVIEQQWPDVDLESKDGNLNVVPLRPKMRGKECQTEKEGEYYMFDLVWGKVRSHPWWPGQIVEPLAASEKAVKYFKKDSYLIAYFGDQTFAWNEAAKIKSFRMHFTQMEKQSNVESFCRAVDCALDEVSRRVEFGLSCPCSPKEHCARIASQTIVNAGIREEASTKYGGDYISSASTFIPVELLQGFKSLAVAPNSGIDRLKFVIGRAQLLAFNHWKGFYKLPELVQLHGLSENDAAVRMVANDEGSSEVKVQGYRADGEASSRKVQLGSSSRKRKNGSSCEEYLNKIISSTADVSVGSPMSGNGEKNSKQKRGRKKGSFKKHEANELVFCDSQMKQRKRILSPENFIEIGEHAPMVASQLDGSTPTLEPVHESSHSVRGINDQKLLVMDFGVASRGSGRPRRKKLLTADIPPEEMLSKICSAASDPKEGYRSICSFISLFSAFRNSICLQSTSARQHKEPTEEHKGGNLSNIETVIVFGSEGTEDSYWKDRIVQGNYVKQVLYGPKSPEEKATPNSKPGTAYNASLNLNNKCMDGGVIESETESPADENTEGYTPTALSLKFSDFESVPSVMDLNSIFSRFGPINESQTQVLIKSKRAKVVFKRRSDAEIAFSSAGKLSLIGPSLLCYRLKPLLVKAPTVTKRKRKGATSE